MRNNRLQPQPQPQPRRRRRRRPLLRHLEAEEQVEARRVAEVLPVEPFVKLDERVDLGRFSRYWREAEPVVWAAY